MLEAINETVSFIKEKIRLQPDVAIILGTGLGGLADDIEVEVYLRYQDIPNFPVSTAPGHQRQADFRETWRKEYHGHAGQVSLL